MQSNALKAILLILVSVIGSVALAEAFLRFVRPVAFLGLPKPVREPEWRELLHRPSEVPGLSYELRPNVVGHARGMRIATNSYGMRSEEPAFGPSDGACNIAAIGDSFTFGYSVDSADAWPTRLQQRLEEEAIGYDIQVLNFGVSGYNARDAAVVAEQRALEWEPALIIFGYVLNDPEFLPIMPLHQQFDDPAWWRYLHLGRLIAKTIRARGVDRLGGGSYVRYLHHESSRSWNMVLDAFRDLGALSKRHDVPILIVVFPLNPGAVAWENYRYHDLHEQVIAAAEGTGMHALDLTVAFSRHSPMSLVTERDRHPSAFGHSVAADAIKEEILEVGLLDCSRNRGAERSG